MLTRILAVGLLAGLLAGVLVALLQQATTTPLILAAETYEKQGDKPVAPGHSHGDGQAQAHAHEHGESWKPADGLPRFFFSSIATIATAVGIALVLVACMIIAGEAIDERRALAWAMAGFVATGLAPAAGLAPELPGAASGDLIGRQAWWAATALATGFALWAFLKTGNWLLRLGAIAILLAPHLVGAPHPHAFESRVPAELAAQFASLSLLVQAVLWAVVGSAVGLLWPRFGARPAI